MLAPRFPGPVPARPRGRPGPRPGPRPRRAPAAGITAFAAAILAGCGIFAGPTATPVPPNPDVRVGPLCAELPQGSDPGGPLLLVDEPAHVALTWIPVVTWFEAATRASGLDEELDAAAGLTILAPVDDAFAFEFSEQSRDDLLLQRQDELRDLLEAHLIDGQHSIADLIAAGELETLAGDRRRFAGSDDGLLSVDDHAGTLCADYEVANARIHVIDGILGELPEHEPGGVDEH